MFLQLARNLHSFEGDEHNFRSWVFTVAHHRLIDERRQRSRRPSDPVPHDRLEPDGWAEPAEIEALDRLSTSNARELLETLSPDQRDVLLLRVLGQLTVEEVAATVGKRPGAVKALQRRALASLQRGLAGREVLL